MAGKDLPGEGAEGAEVVEEHRESAWPAGLASGTKWELRSEVMG